MEPAIHAVRTPDTLLTVVRIAGLHRPPPAPGYAHAILGMYLLLPVLQLLSGLAGITHELFIHHFGVARRSHGGYKGRNSVDDQAKIELARTHRLLRPLPVFN